jgi:serine/threonine-protein kinase
MKQKQPWALQGWTILGQIPGGGQGDTYIVEMPGEPRRGVLKRLRDQSHPERRKRMAREVAILKTIDHAAIPKVLDSNAHEFDSDAVLYMVTELIEGETLAGRVFRGTLSLEDSVALVRRLLAVLRFTHLEGVVHRDIKPDNIILRSSSPADPVLIDFGISFNAAEDAGTALTTDTRPLGNWFYRPPEFQVPGPFRRDARVDLAQTVAVLFYCLTGEFPGAPFDGEGRLPHQRPIPRETLDTLPPTARARLFRIFDRGFTVNIDQRWQSADELDRSVEGLVAPEPGQTAGITLEEAAKLMRESPVFSQRQPIQRRLDDIRTTIERIAARFANALGSGVRRQVGMGPDWSRLRFSGLSVGVTHPFIAELAFLPRFDFQVTGNEVVMISVTERGEEEFFRFPLTGDPDWGQFEDRMSRFYQDGVTRKIMEL